MDDLVVKGLVIPAGEIEETFHTSGGPGGQHANRSETAVRLRFRVADSSLPTEARERIASKLGNVVEVTASEERSQLRNREVARERLAARLEQALERPKRRKRTRRSRAANQRRLDEKRARGRKKRQRRPPRADE